jgi:ketosteroid isomerase-like protein
VYKTAVRWMIRRNVAALNAGDAEPTLAMFAPDARLAFPGLNSWSTQIRPTERGRAVFDTHRGRDEIAAFLRRYVETGIQMEVEDVLVAGPPWRTRVAVRAHVWAVGPEGADVYTNRAVLLVTSRWGRVLHQEDYEDTERAAEFDAVRGEAGPR